jgi:hypothetical protein
VNRGSRAKQPDLQKNGFFVFVDTITGGSTANVCGESGSNVSGVFDSEYIVYCKFTFITNFELFRMIGRSLGTY